MNLFIFFNTQTQEEIVHSLVRTLRFGALGRYIDIVDVIITIKGQYHFVG